MCVNCSRKTIKQSNMTRTEYQRLETLLNKAVLTAINEKQYDVAEVLHTARAVVEDTYIWPDDLSTL